MIYLFLFVLSKWLRSVSGHELKGLMACFSLELPEIAYPLMTLVDFRYLIF